MICHMVPGEMEEAFRNGTASYLLSQNKTALYLLLPYRRGPTIPGGLR